MSDQRIVQATVNGRVERFLCDPSLSLLECLRDELGLTGTKAGCNDGNCGSCAVLLDGELVNSCLVLAVEAHGREITTVEGLAAGEFAALQESFVAEDGLQCGYCTPGFLVAAAALLRRTPQPSDTEIRAWLAGNLCRCTGYDRIVRSVRRAAGLLSQTGSGENGTVADQTPGADASTGDPSATGGVTGTRPPRIDARDKVSGRSLFGADVKLPGMLYGRILRSPHAHARLVSIDTRQALALPGVEAVVTSADLPAARDEDVKLGEGTANFKFLCDNVLASDKVLYHGHAVAAVAATSARIAEAAAQSIRVVYEPLPPVTDLDAAVAEGAPILHDSLRTTYRDREGDTETNVARHFRFELGDPEKAWADAEHIVHREFRSTMVHQGFIEPTAAVASWNPDGSLTVHSSTQGGFTLRAQLSELLEIPLGDIRVIPTEVGGAFGGKITTYIEVPAVLLSRKAGRPVRIVMDRSDVFTSTGPTPGTIIRIRMGASAEGRLVAAEAELRYEAGAYPGSPVDMAAVNFLASYEIPNGRIDGYDILVNKPRTAPYRAPGLTPATWACEQVIDDLAGRVGMDPVEFRLLNAPREGTRSITGMKHKSIGCREVLEAVRNSEHYRSPISGPNRGRGVAHGQWGNWGAQSSATIGVNSDGTVSLTMGSVDLTGTRTSMSMVAADALGVSLEAVRCVMGDTAVVGFSEVSAGSRTTTATSVAVLAAAEDVVGRMKERAAILWKTRPEEIRHAGGRYTSGDREITFTDLAGHIMATGGPVTGVGSVDVKDWGAGFGAHIADVEVDPDTGMVTVLRYTAVQDVGHAIHPGQVEGQMQGGAAQGIGWALYEGYKWDDDGHMTNANLLDYKMATSLDVPEIETVIVEVPYPAHPLGVRGVGEVPIVPPAGAIANAIRNACGASLSVLPMSPSAIIDATERRTP